MSVYFFERFEIMRPAILGKIVRMEKEELDLIMRLKNTKLVEE